MARATIPRLYSPLGEPNPSFNRMILDWLEGSKRVKEHSSPKALDGLRNEYMRAVNTAVGIGLSKRDAHIEALSLLTDLLFDHDLANELQARLDPSLINQGGFRTTLSQGVAKNVGENFVNIITYAIADLLSDRDDILVDKGLPPKLRAALELEKTVPLVTGDRKLKIPIEGDMAIFSRDDVTDAIVISAKTRLKEVFHIGTMWKLLFDAIDDPHSEAKWGLSRAVNTPIDKTLYVFATADMVRTTGRNTQGPDVERDEPRNLIAMDASFFDYVFVSKTGISHVADSIDLHDRGALFHELGCLIELIEKKFSISL